MAADFHIWIGELACKQKRDGDLGESIALLDFVVIVAWARYTSASDAR